MSAARLLVRFATIGVALLGLRLAWPAAEPAGAVVVVEVSPAAGPAARRGALDEALLVDAGLALGWAETDPLIRDRLVRNLRFADPALASEPEEALVARALALGMGRTDPIVRRRLVERALTEIERRTTGEPTESALFDFLEAHAQRFERPGRVAFRQVFLSRDRRGAQLETDARDLLVSLDAAGPDAGVGLGDPLLVLGPHVTEAPAALDRRLGHGFGHAVAGAPVGRWSGPVASAWGLHLVYLTQRSAARPARLAEVRAAVRSAWLEEARATARRDGLERLRAARRWRVSEVTP